MRYAVTQQDSLSTKWSSAVVNLTETHDLSSIFGILMRKAVFLEKTSYFPRWKKYFDKPLTKQKEFWSTYPVFVGECLQWHINLYLYYLYYDVFSYTLTIDFITCEQKSWKIKLRNREECIFPNVKPFRLVDGLLNCFYHFHFTLLKYLTFHVTHIRRRHHIVSNL